MRKIKISITLSGDLLVRIDEAVRRTGGNRSGIIENWLRRTARSRSADLLREETIGYYDSLTAEERAEDRAVSRAAAKHSRRVRYDD